jgi:methionyl-tRNA formyltransferase
MNLVFMGTPDFAVPALQALLSAGHSVLGVFCQPDRPKGRGHKLCPPPVKEEALKHGIPVYQPQSVKNGEALEILKNLNPDCIVVVAYGKLLPKEILTLPKYGCVNIHASLLPKYRGAAPIQWAVLNGDEKTGVSTMQMDEGMDTGDILLTDEMEIPWDMTAGELFEALSPMGAELILKTLKGLEDGSITPIPQNHEAATHAPMLDRSLSALDWSRPAKELHNLIRGLNPWPSAKTQINGKAMKIHASQVLGPCKGVAGQLMEEKQLVVCCGDGVALRLTQVQLDGARRMGDEDLLRGHSFEKGTILQ